MLSYPGVLAAYPETFARFAATKHLVGLSEHERAKLSMPFEEIWPGCWQDEGQIGAICFPVIEDRKDHKLEAIPGPQALAQLLPHAVEQWDKEMIPSHLSVLRDLVEASPAYHLRLGPDVDTISALLRQALPGDPRIEQIDFS